MTLHSHKSRLITHGSIPVRRVEPKPCRGSKRVRPLLLELESRSLLSTLTVTSLADSGTGTLRAEIGLANPGDTIEFKASLTGGTINLTSGTLVVPQSLTILGPGAGKLTISAGGKSSDFVVGPTNPTATTPAIDVTILGLTIANGSSSTGGGGINASQTNLNLIRDNFVNDSALIGSLGGGAVSILEPDYGFDPNTFMEDYGPASLTVTGTTFSGNTSSGNGGAIASFGAPTLITGSSFSNNTAQGFGGAIYTFLQLSASDVLTITSTRFQENSSQNTNAFAQGGAIYSYLPTTITNSVFDDNQAIENGFANGGAIDMGEGSLVISGSTFSDNEATTSGIFGSASGGAISDDFGDLPMTISNSTFVGNSATGSESAQGGAINEGGSGSLIGLTISNSSFLNNLAVTPYDNPSSAGAAGGGAIKTTGGFVTILKTQFVGNQAVAQTNNANSYGANAEGGAVNDFFGTSLALSDSVFLNNQAQVGGSQEYGFAVGGGINAYISSYGPTGSLAITNTQFLSNHAVVGSATGSSSQGGFAQGGGLDLLGNVPVTLTGLTVVGNSAIGGSAATGGDGQGGGLAVLYAPAVTVSYSLFAGNLAQGGNSPTGVAGDGQGGAIYSSSGGSTPPTSMTLTNDVITFSQATGGNGVTGGNGEGGGVWADGLIAITSGSIVGNDADEGSAGQGLGGGLYFASPATPTIGKKVMLLGNYASTSGNDQYHA